MTDPFADVIPADENTDEGFDTPPAEAPKKAPAKKAAPKPKVEQDEEGNFRLGITLKGGAGFDVPWLTPAYSSWEAAATDLSDPDVENRTRHLLRHVQAEGGAVR
mgnify:CR=1 FL=1